MRRAAGGSDKASLQKNPQNPNHLRTQVMSSTCAPLGTWHFPEEPVELLHVLEIMPALQHFVVSGHKIVQKSPPLPYFAELQYL